MTEEAGAISPSRLRGTCAQDRLDTVLLDQVTRRGVEVRYGTELLALHQHPDHVTGTLRGPAGEVTVEAGYVVAADGADSTVRRLLGIPVSGPGPLGDELVNILFEADLAPLLGDRRFALCQITHPDAPGLVVAIDGECRWCSTPAPPRPTPAPRSAARWSAPRWATPTSTSRSSARSAGARSRGSPTASGTAGCSWPVTPRTRSRRSARSA
jgi:2-polyprenyl-6-methoxyphenol hydroxylase-like FAD-dependent oxidoreductase